MDRGRPGSSAEARQVKCGGLGREGIGLDWSRREKCDGRGIPSAVECGRSMA